jgi:hypothetical protein
MHESNLGSQFQLAAKPEGVTLTRWLYDEIRGAILSGRLKRRAPVPIRGSTKMERIPQMS